MALRKMRFMGFPSRGMSRRAFSLVELLIVVGIIAVLIAILMPTLSLARESARRTLCASRLRQIVAANILYATENTEHMIPGTRDDGFTQTPPNYNTEHCIWISHEAYNAYVKYGGSNLILTCPNLEESGLPFDPGANGGQTIGWVMGYNFLGGHVAMQRDCGWTSPMKATEAGSLPVACDLNDWAPFDGWTCVGHAYKIPAAAFVYDGGKTALQYPSAGGNVGYLDGSVSWKPIATMMVHQDCTNGGQYYGMF